MLTCISQLIVRRQSAEEPKPAVGYRLLVNAVPGIADNRWGLSAASAGW